MNYKLEKNELENKVTITFNFSQEEFEQAIKNTNKEDRNQAIQEAVDSLISSSYSGICSFGLKSTNLL